MNIQSCLQFIPNKRYSTLLIITLILSTLALFNYLGGIQSYDEWKCETFDRPQRGWVTTPEPQNMHGGKWTLPPPPSGNNTSSITNSTLGFQAIYVLGMPDRTDKRDAMDLAAALTGLQITWAEGVDPSHMNPQTVPPARLDKGSFIRYDGEIGCWRGHMNVLRSIVHNGIASALILEDDTDWDVHIATQMEQFAPASRAVLAATEHLSPRRHRSSSIDEESESASESESESEPASPFGTGWDILWLGHCGGYQPNPAYAPYHAIIDSDPTVPPAFDMRGMTRDIQSLAEDGAGAIPCSTHEGHDPSLTRACDSPRLAQDQRIVHFNPSPLCTFGYAVSQQGARKMLAALGGLAVKDLQFPIDLQMLNLCRNGVGGNGDSDGDGGGDREEGFRCVVVSPPYFSHHKPRGSKTGDSDIHRFCGGTEREVGYSEGLVWSTRLNVENLIKRRELEAQYVLNEDGKRWELKRADQYLAR